MSFYNSSLNDPMIPRKVIENEKNTKAVPLSQKYKKKRE